MRTTTGTGNITTQWAALIQTHEDGRGMFRWVGTTSTYFDDRVPTLAADEFTTKCTVTSDKLDWSNQTGMHYYIPTIHSKYCKSHRRVVTSSGMFIARCALLKIGVQEDSVSRHHVQQPQDRQVHQEVQRNQ